MNYHYRRGPVSFRFPKTNVEWEVCEEPHRMGTRIKGTLQLWNGERLEHAVIVSHDVPQEYVDHTIFRLIEDLEREVGKRMVRG